MADNANPPSRGTALLFHPAPEARALLGEALTRLSFEAIPLGELASLRRFADGLAPKLVLVPPAAFDENAVLELTRRRDLTVVALGEPTDEDETTEASKARARAIHLPLQGATSVELARRLELVLLASKVGLELDVDGERLIGSIAQVPFLEVAQRLATADFQGRLELSPHEWLTYENGRPLDARAGKASGVKAFCRLAQRLEGAIAVRPGPRDPHSLGELQDTIDVLVQRAVSDNLSAPVDPESRLRIELGPSFFEQEFSPLEKQLLTLAQKPTTVAAALDALPATDGEISYQIGRLVQRGFLVVDKPTTRVRLVTDSTADLPIEVARANGILVVPLRVHFGDKVFRDRLDLQPRQFYDLLTSGGHHPQSSPPPPEDFQALYRQLLPQSDVVSVHISSTLSLTGANATQASQVVLPGAPGRRIEIVDSRHAGLALGLLTLFGARLAARGQDAPAIAAKLRELSGRMQMLFGVDTLEFLVKGGRLSKARGFFGSMLGIRPILAVEGGAIVPLDRVRGGRAVQPRLLELLAQKVDPKKPILAAILHAAAPVWADNLRKLLLERFRCAEVILGEIGPVVGTHTGPGTVGIAALQPTPEELALLAPAS